jgi:ABC-2 type transport system permease protein
MNIFLHEFKTYLKSVLIWSLALVLIIMVFLSIFTSFAIDAAVFSQMMSSFPKELLVAFGMENFDWSNILGFFAVVFLFCQLCLAIQAANYGFGLVSIEERELTADFLLAKPVSRSRILTSKLLAALVALTITNAVVWVTSFAAVHAFQNENGYNSTALLLLLASIVILQLFFFSVGLLISLLVKRVRSITPFSLALAFGMYFLNAFSDMAGGIKLEIISPFKQFDANYIIRNTAYDAPLALLCAAVIVASVAGSYWLYSRRNIRAAV